MQIVQKKQSPLAAFGKGVGDAIPKAVESYTLRKGLENIGNQKDMTPFQRFAAMSSIPGVTPQMIESGSRLLQHEAQGKALSPQNAPKPSPFPQNQPQQQAPQEGSKTPSLTESDLLADVQAGYEPPSIPERDAIAGEAYNANPARFNNDPKEAIAWADDQIVREQEQYNAKAARYANLDKIQTNVVNRLNDQYKKLEAKVPSEIYSKIEDKAILATKPKKLGGGGLTEQQAMKDYGEELNNASKDWSKIPTWGSWGVTSKSANETLRAMKSTQEKMEALDATDLFAQQMQKDNQISPKLSYAIAQPVKRIPQLNNTLKQLPDIKAYGDIKNPNGINEQIAPKKTMEIAPKLGEILKNNENASPLAIAYELEKKGYDPNTWLNWVTNNSKSLNLRQKQTEQLTVPQQHIAPMADWWLQTFSGIE